MVWIEELELVLLALKYEVAEELELVEETELIKELEMVSLAPIPEVGLGAGVGLVGSQVEGI